MKPLLSSLLIVTLLVVIFPAQAQTKTELQRITTSNGQQVTELAALPVDGQVINQVLFSPDDTSLVVASAGHDPNPFDNTISVWKLADKQRIVYWQHHGFSPRSLTFSPDGKVLAALGYDFSESEDKPPLGLLQWDSATGMVKDIYVNPFKDWRKVGLEGGQNAAAYSPDGHLAVSGNMEGAFFLWDTVTGQLLQTIDNNAADLDRYEINSALFSHSGKFLVTANGDGTIQCWQVVNKSLKLIRSLNTGAQRNFTMALSQDGLKVAAVSEDGIQIWDTQTGKVIRKFPYASDLFQPSTTNNFDLAFNADGGLIAVLQSDLSTNRTQIKLWDITNGVAITQFELQEWASSLTFNHAGTLIASAGNHGVIHLWGVQLPR